MINFMKRLTIMTSEMEARMFTNHLKSHGIKVVMSGNKEYASIITGQDNGRFEILVAEDDFDEAKQLTQKLNLQIQTEPPLSSSEVSSAFLAYKKSIIFALMSIIILPIIFNISSFYYLYKFIKSNEVTGLKKPVLILVSLILNISFGFIGVIVLLKTFSHAVN